jgi:hypothetical protein
VSDQSNRAATPLIEGRACQPWGQGQFDGPWQDIPGDAAREAVPSPDLYIISHDLRNQITSIKGWADLLQRRVEAGTDRAAILQGLTTIRSSTEAMEELLGDMIVAGSVTTGRERPPIRAEVDLWDLSERLIVQQRALAEGHSFRLIGPGSGHVVGAWDARSVERILTNFLNNAVKYSPDGGDIAITVGRNDREARLAVQDHGLGIPSLALAHIFEPFYRAGNLAGQHDASSIPGFGIGLYAAQNLARRHGGQIEVSSVERQGSRFTLVLPLRDLPRARDDERAASRPSDPMKEWVSMLNDANPERPLTPDGEGHESDVAQASRNDATGQGVMPPKPLSDPNWGDAETDIVDFQSMQSFPASDPPAWPSVPAERPETEADEQGRA